MTSLNQSLIKKLIFLSLLTLAACAHHNTRGPSQTNHVVNGCSGLMTSKDKCIENYFNEDKKRY